MTPTQRLALALTKVLSVFPSSRPRSFSPPCSSLPLQPMQLGLATMNVRGAFETHQPSWVAMQKQATGLSAQKVVTSLRPPTFAQRGRRIEPGGR